MPNERSRARKLSTKSELALVDSSYPPALGKLSERAVKGNLARARRLRDKQDDLLRRQRLANRRRTGSKHGVRGETNERTREKRELFQAALDRFDRRLRALQKPAKARKPPKVSSGKDKRPAPSVRHKAGPPPKHGPAALRQKARSPRMMAIHAHAGSRGRRKQAARDARR